MDLLDVGLDVDGQLRHGLNLPEEPALVLIDAETNHQGLNFMIVVSGLTNVFRSLLKQDLAMGPRWVLMG